MSKKKKVLDEKYSPKVKGRKYNVILDPDQ
jgi:hypothetical protein